MHKFLSFQLDRAFIYGKRRPVVVLVSMSFVTDRILMFTDFDEHFAVLLIHVLVK